MNKETQFQDWYNKFVTDLDRLTEIYKCGKSPTLCGLVLEHLTLQQRYDFTSKQATYLMYDRYIGSKNDRDRT